LSKFNDSKIVQGVMKGIRPATVGLIAAGVIFLAQEVQLAIVPIAICGATIIMSGYFKINPIIITVVMAIAGG
ncbi:chromate transporter, partial [Acinetobacter baumannii]|nr:chromate transporter [Acinetobacter baumannii]